MRLQQAKTQAKHEAMRTGHLVYVINLVRYGLTNIYATCRYDALTDLYEGCKKVGFCDSEGIFDTS